MTPLPCPTPGWLQTLQATLPADFPDEILMALLHEAALENVRRGGGPFAAALLGPGNTLIELNVNQVLTTRDPAAHAEQIVMRNGLARLQAGGFPGIELRGCRLFSTAEPCTGCRGAIYLFAPSEVRWSLSKKQVEETAPFTEGPPNPEFWPEALEKRAIKSVPNFALTESALRPLQEYARLCETGKIQPYLTSIPQSRKAD